MSLEPQWKLELALLGPFGERYIMAIALDGETAREVNRVEPPHAVPFMPSSLDETVKILKRREFRKELFKYAAERLGALLAERMEDAEGWHDVSRQEPAKKQLRGE